MTILENLDLLKEALHEAGLSALSVTIIKGQAETLLIEVDRLTAENERLNYVIVDRNTEIIKWGNINEAQAEQLGVAYAELQTVKAEKDAAVEEHNELLKLIAKRLDSGRLGDLCDLADELNVVVAKWRGRGKQK